MESIGEAQFRLRLSEGFMKEAEDFFKHSHWRSCVSSAQLAVENAAKAVLALFQPLVKMHGLSKLLVDLVEEHEFRKETQEKIEKLADHARVLGFEEHIRTDYGDELGQRTPWEIYHATHAEKALSMAKDSYHLAVQIIEDIGKEPLRGAGG